MKKSNLPRYKSGWGTWKYLTSPGPYYFGGGLHYVNKQGKFIHAKAKEKFEDIKLKVMTKTQFQKMFGHLLKDKDYMFAIKNLTF
jgi:hypothetical protein